MTSIFFFLFLRHFEPYKHFILPENNKIDSSLQMQALAMQYLSPEQAGKCKLYPLFTCEIITFYIHNNLINEINNNSY